ncbi:MAG: glycoside hydrolase family 172 protein [Planctomycetota bacterium]
MRLLSFLMISLVALVSASLAEERISQADLLRRMIDLDRLMTPPAGERTGMFSSYDRRSRIDARGKYLDWDANNDRGQFMRQLDNGWAVMAEMEGPGAITRIWSANPHGQIRVILDGQEVLATDFANLFNGQQPPLAEPLCYVTPGGGHNCYFPIGYENGCQVLIRNSTSYYQINYVSFPQGTQVQTFKLELDEAAQAVREEVSTALLDGLSDRQLFGEHWSPPVGNFAELRQGQKLEIESYAGGGIIRALYVGLADRRLPPEPYALHRYILRIFFDGEESPSVEVPLIDFFGSGFEPHFFNSLVQGTDKWTTMQGVAVTESRFMYCHFPMPFNDVARIEIENLGKKKIGLMMWARIDRTRPPAEHLRFKARYRREDPCQILDYPVLETTGAGRLVGCTLNIDCPRRAWWGEGDDKVWIDGENFPSFFGTGTEDYLGDAWGLHAHANAYQGATRAAPYGKNSAYRWHIADCINFQRSIRFTLENWQHAGARDTYYGTVVYWYGEQTATDFFEPLTLKDLTPPGLRIPDSVEIEDHLIGDDWGNLIKQKYAGGVELSGGSAANITSDQPVRANIPSERARVARLKLRTHPRRSFDKIEISTTQGRQIGTVSYDRAANGMYTAGVVRLRPGDNILLVDCRPKAVLDCWILEEIPTRARGPEGEDLKLLSGTGVNADIEYATLDWSGGAQLVLDFKEPDQTATLALPTQQEDTAYSIQLLITRSPAGGHIQTLIDDQPLGKAFNTFNMETKIERVVVGSVQLKAGEHTISFHTVRNNPQNSGIRLGLDAVEMLKVHSPFALECEMLAIVDSQGTNHAQQEIRGASAGEQIWCRATTPEAWIEFETHVAQAGRYRLSIVYTTSFDYGIVRTFVNGTPAGKPVDTFGQLAPGPVRVLGNYDLPAGPLKIRSQVVGKNEQSPGYYFGVDCVILEPLGS